MLFIESDESPEEIAELVRMAHQMCFTEAALTGQGKLKQRHYLNGQPFEVDEA